MLNGNVSLQCPTAEYPCRAQPPSIPAVPNNSTVSLQRPTATAEYSCSTQQQSIPAVLNPTVSLHPCSAQAHSISAAFNGKVSLSCPALAMPNPTAFNRPCGAKLFLQCLCNAARKTVWVGGGGGIRVGGGGRQTSCAITALGPGCSKYIVFFFDEFIYLFFCRRFKIREV